jgi:exodeoxyribonuclease V gamma subunit
MGIHLNISTSLDRLSDQLINDLSADQLGVFDLQWIVTQTEGNNNRIRQQVAARNGIAAGIRFVKMKDVLIKIYKVLSPGSELFLDRDRMTWAIYDILHQQEFVTRFPAIATYYLDNDTRRVALASEMADLFDQYQIYRHDQISLWKEASAEPDADLIWQAYLWNKMRSRLGDDYIDQIDVYKRLLTKIKDESLHDKIKKIFPALRFFGHAIFTPYYLNILSELSKVIEIQFYLLNPCPEHPWMHDSSERRIARLRNKKESAYDVTGPKGNELLVNWGTVLKESYYLLLNEEEYVNVYNVIDPPAMEENPKTLLQKIQYEIHNSIPNESREQIDDEMLQDESFHLVGCYTPVREVEVLYNYLIHLFANHKDMRARDVLVMVTDIDLYAPFIKAVFDNGPVKIPYAIADESVSGGNSLFHALQHILSVNAESFTSDDVLCLLDSPYIRKRFGFSDISEVRRAVREAGIFFGHSELNPGYASDLNEAWMVSWEYGLRKIMYGLCMSGEESFDDGEYQFYPLDSAEGGLMLDRIRLYHFVQTLKEILKKRLVSRTLSEWVQYLGEVMREMILDEDENDEDFPRFNNLLDSITPMQEIMQEPLPYTTFRQVFFDKLSQERRSGSFGGKGVNFCSMIPMRSIPYKMIALLGMNFDSFPRQDSMLSFSLLAKGEKRMGDRSIRENDKHLFLESLLAAREKFYISYLARDVQKGSEKPPSTLVDELLDYITYCAKSGEAYKKTKAIIHPLHLFSPEYRKERSLLLPNYLGNTLVSEVVFEPDPNSVQDRAELSEIGLDQLAKFFKHPVKYFFNKTLGVYYRKDEERLPETELFELDYLQSWKVKDDLLRPNINLEEYIIRNKRRGQLPLGNMGNVIVENFKSGLLPYEECISQIIQNESPQRIEVRYDCQEEAVLITGSIEVYGNKYVQVCNSSSTLKNIMIPWVNYLFARATGNDQLGFYYIFKNKTNNPQIFFIGPSHISGEAARILVRKLIHFFKTGHDRPLPFYAPFGYYYYHQPRGADKPARNLVRENLYSEYEAYIDDDRPDKYDAVFTNGGYLEKVIEDQDTDAGYFSTQSIVEMNEYLPQIMQPLYDQCPALFKK